MRRFLDKVFKDSTIGTQQGAPSLPSDLTYSELIYKTKRGFLAQKLSQYLGQSIEEGNSLFYLSFSKSSFPLSKIENDKERLLQLSEQMLTWSQHNQDVPRKIKTLTIKNDIQNAMLKAFDMYKQDLFSINNLSNELEIESDSSKQNDNTTWTVYRDVIFAATQSRFLLISKEEVSKYTTGHVLCEGTIKERTDIPLCRNRAKESVEHLGVNKSTVMSWLLVLSEAITNTIKHAEEGKMTLVSDVDNNEIRFVIEDKGPGFPLIDLPKTTLLAGYSTKKSMGQGFTLMMKMTKQILLYTSSSGSVLILSFDLNKGGGNNNE